MTHTLPSWLIFIPIISGLLLYTQKFKDPNLYKGIGLAVSVGLFILSLFLLSGEYSSGGYAFVHYTPWIKSLGISYFVAVDGISLYLVLLTTLLFPLAFLSLHDVKERLKEYVALMLILEGALIGVFCALDLALFYIFWELMLIPTYILIGAWGGKESFYTAIKFVLYTLVGSLLFLVAILILVVQHYQGTGELTFNYLLLQETSLSLECTCFLFFCFALAFLIKTPMFPLHSWMPHAYLNSPYSVVIILTGVMSKTGLYGLMRFNFALFPDVSYEASGIFIIFALIGIIYGAWCAIGHDDLKGVAAFASLSHLNFILLGLFAFNTIGESAALLQMFNHGIVAAALFFFIGLIEQRTGKRSLSSLKGLAEGAPLFSGIFFLIALATLGLPGLNTFVGEFLILMGLWTSEASAYAGTVVVLSTISILFASIYMLHLYQGTMHEKESGTVTAIAELKGSELAGLLPICFFIVYIGLAPAAFTNRINGATDKLVLFIDDQMQADQQTEQVQHIAQK